MPKRVGPEAMVWSSELFELLAWPIQSGATLCSQSSSAICRAGTTAFREPAGEEESRKSDDYGNQDRNPIAQGDVVLQSKGEGVCEAFQRDTLVLEVQRSVA